MITAIRKLDRKTRQGVLAGLALDLTDPGVSEPSQVIEEYRSYYENILQEIKRNLRINSQDESLKARSRIYEVLSRELRQLVLENNQIPTVRERLGYQGYLSTKEYEVHFRDEFHELCEPLGVTKRETLEAIKTPNNIQHFLPEKFGHTAKNALSLFLKTYASGDDPYSLLVDVFRSGATLNIHYVTRIFHSELDLSNATTSVDYLRAFAERYGVEFEIGKTKSKFVLYQTVPVDKSVSKQNLFQMSHSKNQTVDGRFTYRRSGDDWEIALAYAIDVRDYAKSLRSHGIRVTRKNT